MIPIVLIAGDEKEGQEKGKRRAIVQISGT
jgi:hypothetical protein